MATASTTTTASALKQYWIDFFLQNLYDNLAMGGLTKVTKIPTGQGKVVWWHGISKVNPAGAVASTEGADPTARSVAATRISGTLAEYNNLIKANKLLIDTAIDGTKKEIMMDLSKDAAKLLDDTLLAKALGGGTVLFADAKTHRSNIILAASTTVKDIRKAVRLLRLSSVPTFQDGFYVGLVHPDVAFDLMTDSAWLDVSKYRDTVKYDIKGELGRLYGVRFKECPTIPILTNSGSADCDVYRSLIISPDFLGQSELGDLDIVINEPGKASELGRYNTYGYNFVMATEVLSNQKAIRIEGSSGIAE